MQRGRMTTGAPRPGAKTQNHAEGGGLAGVGGGGQSVGSVAGAGAVPGQTQAGGAALFWSTPRGCGGVYNPLVEWVSISKNIEPRDKQIDSNMWAIPATFYAY